MPPRTSAGRLASLLILTAAWIAPGARRPEFRAEWLAEIHDAADLIARDEKQDALDEPVAPEVYGPHLRR